jgi:histidyl-tRNA synthetase
MAGFQTLPGFREFYPEDLARRNHIFRLWRRTAVAFGFEEYDAPVLEPLDLYRRKSGDEIEAQLFSFTDKGGREVALRPEMTPTVCRLVGARANALKRPIKWFSVAEFYRYERMQKGRGRCFFQFNADIFGEPGPEAEIELIALLVQCLRSFGLTSADFHVRLSDRNLWFHYLEALGLDEAKSAALIGAVDKFERAGDVAFKPFEDAHGTLDPAIKEKVVAFLGIKSIEALEEVLAPLAVERLIGTNENAKTVVDQIIARLADWRTILAGVRAMGLGEFVTVDLGVVRGLAYYTGFVFEAFDRKGELRALAGGGRYDDLVEKLGGPKLPAVGFAIGDMTMALLLEERGLTPPLVSAPDCYALIGGPAERLAAFAGIQELRAAGYRVDYPLKQVGFGKQFKAAGDSGPRLALIYGGDEVAKGIVKVKDLRDGTEHEFPAAGLLSAVRDMLG